MPIQFTSIKLKFENQLLATTEAKRGARQSEEQRQRQKVKYLNTLPRLSQFRDSRYVLAYSRRRTFMATSKSVYPWTRRIDYSTKWTHLIWNVTRI